MTNDYGLITLTQDNVSRVIEKGYNCDLFGNEFRVKLFSRYFPKIEQISENTGKIQFVNCAMDLFYDKGVLINALDWNKGYLCPKSFESLKDLAFFLHNGMNEKDKLSEDNLIQKIQKIQVLMLGNIKEEEVLSSYKEFLELR